MSNDNSAIKNKQQTHQKVYFEQYLDNTSEPLDDISRDTPPELEAELLESSLVMKRRFRHIAQSLRKRYF